MYRLRVRACAFMPVQLLKIIKKHYLRALKLMSGISPPHKIGLL